MIDDMQSELASENLRSWRASLKIAGFSLVLFLIACFAYGWYFKFTFWHAYADAGFNSAIAYAIYYGVFAGPFLFAAVTLIARFLIKK